MASWGAVVISQPEMTCFCEFSSVATLNRRRLRAEQRGSVRQPLCFPHFSHCSENGLISPQNDWEFFQALWAHCLQLSNLHLTVASAPKEMMEFSTAGGGPEIFTDLLLVTLLSLFFLFFWGRWHGVRVDCSRTSYVCQLGLELTVICRSLSPALGLKVCPALVTFS